MTIQNNTNMPFKAAILVGQGKNIEGQNTYIGFILKSTFDLYHDNVCQVAAEENQLPIFESDQFIDPDRECPKVEGDYIIYKPKTDVIVLGKGYFHENNSVNEKKKYFDVSISVNGAKKVIRIFPDRIWEAKNNNLEATRPDFNLGDTIELNYMNAFGGKYDNRNPVGKGYYQYKDSAVGQPLPNLEDPDNLITAWNHKPDPQCFSWVGRAWVPRIGLAGNVSEPTENEPTGLPDDFKWEFNNGVAEDQALPFLQGNEEIELSNCNQYGQFRFTLPGIIPTVHMEFMGRTENVPVNLDTLCIMMETELEIIGNKKGIERQAYCVWRAKITHDEHHSVELLKRISIGIQENS